MLPRLCCPPRRTVVLLLSTLLLVSLPLNTHQARRSRIDLPIQNSADAPLEDNIATASGNEAQIVQAEPLVAVVPAPANSSNAPVAVTPKPEEDVPVAAAVTAEQPEQLTDVPPIDTPSVEECETDNLGYELVTG